MCSFIDISFFRTYNSNVTVVRNILLSLVNSDNYRNVGTGRLKLMKIYQTIYLSTHYVANIVKSTITNAAKI